MSARLHHPLHQGCADGEKALNWNQCCSLSFGSPSTSTSPSLDPLGSLHLSVRPGVSGGQRDHHGGRDPQHDRRGLQQPHSVRQSQQRLVSVFLSRSAFVCRECLAMYSLYVCTRTSLFALTHVMRLLSGFMSCNLSSCRDSEPVKAKTQWAEELDNVKMLVSVGHVMIKQPILLWLHLPSSAVGWYVNTATTGGASSYWNQLKSPTGRSLAHWRPLARCTQSDRFVKCASPFNNMVVNMENMHPCIH